jgi:hypothetical protein
MTAAVLAFSLSASLTKYGALAGFAAIVGLAVLSLLYFAQAREVRRLRDWAGRAPERAQEVQQRLAAEASARVERPAMGVAQPLVTPARAVSAAGPATRVVSPAGEAAALGAAGAPDAGPAAPGALPDAPAPPGAAQPAIAGVGAAAAVVPALATSQSGGGAGVAPAEAAAVAASAPAAPAGGGAVPLPASSGAAVTAPAPPAEPVGQPSGSSVRPPAPPAPAGGAVANGPASPPVAPSSVLGTAPATAAASARLSRGAALAPEPGAASNGTPSVGAPPADPADPERRASPRPPAPASPRRPLAPVHAAASPRRAGVGRLGQVRRTRGTLTALIVAGVVAVAVVIVVAVTLLGGGSPSKPAATTITGTGTATHKSGSKTPVAAAGNPATLKVAVINGTSASTSPIEGLAARLSGTLRQNGYGEARYLNVHPATAVSKSTIYYGVGHQADAQEVAQVLGIGAVAPMTTTSRRLAGAATVLVMAGADQGDVSGTSG